MPKGNGTGPPKGVTGRGGRMGGNRAGAGPEGNCICPNCGKKVPHQQGIPCMKVKCPECGTIMTRE